MRRECLDHVVVFGERTPPSRAAVVHEISQRGADAFIFGEGCAGLARRRTSRAHFLPPNSRRATPPIYPDLIYDRHRRERQEAWRRAGTRGNARFEKYSLELQPDHTHQAVRYLLVTFELGSVCDQDLAVIEIDDRVVVERDFGQLFV